MKDRPINLCVLGCTGSIGNKALEMVRAYPGSFRISSLVAGKNLELLLRQVKEFEPGVVGVLGEKELGLFRALVGGKKDLGIYSGKDGLIRAICIDEVDIVINAISGSAGLYPSYVAILNKKNLALANKESLVMAGPLLMALARKSGVWVRPIDSEHSGIFQILSGHRGSEIRQVYITASGGPFRGRPLEELRDVSVKDALRHPNWKMGPKITIDSATLMNKGLEVMEAMWLFDLRLEQINILIHPQSIVHAIVEFLDGSMIAQFSVPDMIIPVAYALSFPTHRDILSKGLVRPMDIALLNGLDFEIPDLGLYPCLRLALSAAREGRSYPVVLNGANEVAVEAFLKGLVKFPSISAIIESVMELHQAEEICSLDQVFQIDDWAREKAWEFVRSRDR